MATEITEAIFDLVETFGMHPYYINDGECENFADQISDIIEGAESRWGNIDEHLFSEKHYPQCHCYIVYRGRYYDAEEPFGISNPTLLSFFVRQADQWKERNVHLNAIGGKIPV